ncbi:MAG: triose-phosphate isomerase [Alphaproteobacteria bacterium]|nr:triose-phosphate isomerase [Alphaproteobacteria bacterium]
MTKLIVANWKMNGTLESTRKFCQQITSFTQESKTRNTLVICPPALYLKSLKNDLKEGDIKTGAQDCSAFSEGAYTGEISARMLDDIGCEYVLIGHSERRQYHQESNDLLSQKIQRALEAGLCPIFCIGESEGDHEAGRTQDVLREQLKVLGAFKGNKSIVLAYEPVWAIGTGKVATLEDIQNACAFIKEILFNEYAVVSPILYGGSVKGKNASSILSLPAADGVLVGGASLQASEFWEIATAV